MANDFDAAEADSTAVRVALWRAMHVQVDDAPHPPDPAGQPVDPDAHFLMDPVIVTASERTLGEVLRRAIPVPVHL
jgi:hypothetical protein